jgi:enoyl-CoA hydratase/carnithine racemase
MTNSYSENSYTTIKLKRSGGVTSIVIDNPPVNVITLELLNELRAVLIALEVDEDTKVIVFESANSEFFIAHFDMSIIDNLSAFDDLARLAPAGMNFTQAFAEQVRHQPQVTIVKLKGIARGGGSELLLAADMCFASHGSKVSQCEALMGVLPGGGVRHTTSLGELAETELSKPYLAPSCSMRKRWRSTAGLTVPFR